MNHWEDFDDYEGMDFDNVKIDKADPRDFGLEGSYEEELFAVISQDDEEQYSFSDEWEDEEFLRMGKKDSRSEE